MGPRELHSVLTLENAWAVGGHFLNRHHLVRCLIARAEQQIYINSLANTPNVGMADLLVQRMAIYACSKILKGIHSSAPVQEPSNQTSAALQDYEQIEPINHAQLTGAPYPHANMGALLAMSIHRKRLMKTLYPGADGHKQAELAMSLSLEVVNHAGKNFHLEEWKCLFDRYNEAKSILQLLLVSLVSDLQKTPIQWPTGVKKKVDSWEAMLYPSCPANGHCLQGSLEDVLEFAASEHVSEARNSNRTHLDSSKMDVDPMVQEEIERLYDLKDDI